MYNIFTDLWQGAIIGRKMIQQSTQSHLNQFRVLNPLSISPTKWSNKHQQIADELLECV